MGCFYHFCPCQELRRSLTEEEIKRGSSKRDLEEFSQGYIQEKSFTVVEMWECEWWRLYKTATNVKIHIRENFLTYRTTTLEGMKKRNLFGYVQCDIEVPGKLRANFANFPPIFKNTLVSKNDIGDLIKTYTEEERILSQPGKMLISSFTLRNAILITPLPLFYLQLAFVATKIHRFVMHNPKIRFNSFVQAAVDKNLNSSVVAETRKLLANSSLGYQNKERSRHTVMKYLSYKKTHEPNNSKLFKG